MVRWRGRLTSRAGAVAGERRPVFVQLDGHLQHVVEGQRAVALGAHGAGEEGVARDHVTVNHLVLDPVTHPLRTGGRGQVVRVRREGQMVKAN